MMLTITIRIKIGVEGRNLRKGRQKWKVRSCLRTGTHHPKEDFKDLWACIVLNHPNKGNHPAERHVLQNIHSVVYLCGRGINHQYKYCDLIATGPTWVASWILPYSSHQSPVRRIMILPHPHSPGSVPCSPNYLGLACLPELPTGWYMNGLAACPFRSPLSRQPFLLGTGAVREVEGNIIL